MSAVDIKNIKTVIGIVSPEFEYQPITNSKFGAFYTETYQGDHCSGATLNEPNEELIALTTHYKSNNFILDVSAKTS